MKCRTCCVIIHHARQCDDCTRQVSEPLGIIALDEQGSMPRRPFPWPLVLAILTAVAVSAAYIATEAHDVPKWEATN